MGEHDSCKATGCECTCHAPKGGGQEIPDRMTSHLNEMNARY